MALVISFLFFSFVFSVEISLCIHITLFIIVAINESYKNGTINNIIPNNKYGILAEIDFIILIFSSILKLKYNWVFPLTFILLIFFLIMYFITKNKKSNNSLVQQENSNYFSSVLKNITNNYENTEDYLDTIDYMSGQEFENLLINELLPNEGYTDINGTSYTGDYGVDIVAYNNNGIKCAIQCKRFNNKVSNKAIQEVVAGKKHYKCEKAIVITNNYYTKSAKELAFDNKVELLDRDDLIKMIKRKEHN